MASRKRKTITISAAVIKWARTTSFGGKVEEAALKLKISKDQLFAWETNDPTITMLQLKRLSKVFGRRVAVFLLKTPPKSLEAPKFRKLPNLEYAYLDRKTLRAIRDAQEIQNDTIYLLQNKKNEFLRKMKFASISSEVLANKVIKTLNISVKNRFKGKDSRDQLNIWKRVLQSFGILVLEIGFPLSDARAFAVHNLVAPVIVLNNKDTDNARVFSLFHELGHLILGQSDIDEEINLGTIHSVEKYCNEFAANSLVPTDLLKSFLVGVSQIDDEIVQSIAKQFKVSRAVIWTRLHSLHMISENQFNMVRSRLSTFEPYSQSGSKREFKANKNSHLYSAIKHKSELFINEVFNAYNESRITYFDMVDYIGIKSEYIPKLQRLMFA